MMYRACIGVYVTTINIENYLIKLLSSVNDKKNYTFPPSYITCNHTIN